MPTGRLYTGRRTPGTFRAVGIDCVSALAVKFDQDQNWLRRLVPSQDELRESGVIAHKITGFIHYFMRRWWVR